MTDCVLHIGLEKTGTTSIQSTLAANRDRMLSRGILYPRSLGARSHVKAYAYASEGPSDEIKVKCGLYDRPTEEFRRDLLKQFDEEVASATPEKIIISNEHLSSRLMSGSELSRLRTLLSRHCRSIKVVVYLRAQGDAHRSAYSTYIKTGAWMRFMRQASRCCATDIFTTSYCGDGKTCSDETRWTFDSTNPANCLIETSS